MAPSPAARRRLARACAALLTAGSLACGAAEARRAAEPPPVGGRLFTRLPSDYTGVRFENRLTETREMNVLTYRNFFNGGGVAIGDLNGDGLPEIVLTANEGGPRLYLNEGRFRFRDVTAASRLRHAAGSWTTGVTLADVNGDGRLDVYICRAGLVEPAARANELWINEGAGRDGVPRFAERAREYGVADEGWSTHAAVLDFDRDGDLDLFVINNSPKPLIGFGSFYTRTTADRYSGAKLYRNDGPSHDSGRPRFVEVTEQAGIYSPANGFGLGVGVGDVNRDGWPDVYVANDFLERDFLYVNRGDGTFAETLDSAMTVVSQFSMGMDIADVDDDGWPDIYTTDMLPEGETRLRTTSAFESWDTYQARVRNGYHHQLMRNMLQHNRGDPSPRAGGAPTFGDVAWMAGVARTDWSWSALIADLDLDGRRDIYVTNGVARDVTSQDYVAFATSQPPVTQAGRPVAGAGGDAYRRLLDAMPSTPLPNYAFRNAGGLAFTNEAAAWGLDTPAFSSGAAYGDLDGDGALDLVVNNVDGEAFVYRNDARALRREHHFLQVRLDGAGANRFGVGARVTVHAGGDARMQEEYPARGFQSSVDYVLTFGLGPSATVDSLTVEWPDGRVSALGPLAADRRVTVRQAEAAAPRPRAADGGAGRGAERAPLLAVVADSAAFPFTHRENEFRDFDRERLVPKRLSTEGPTLAVGDVNGDGLDDVYVGGAREQAGRLLLQRPGGTFVPTDTALFQADAPSEDVGATFLDADGDGDQDLYVVSGGSELVGGGPDLQDRLYLNDGRGRFRKAAGALPAESSSGSRAVAADYDGDGDVDLFVGGRVVPGRYGVAPRSLLLRNDGRGHFTDDTERLAPALAHVGMVTDAVWQDVDGDGRPDLVVVGEWMPITVFRNAGGGRLAPLAVPGLARSHGWWNRIVAADVTGDGRVDLVVGNLGLDTRLQASEAEPVTMYVKDLAGDGSLAQIVAVWDRGRQWPLVLRDDLVAAIPRLKPRFPTYASYARATLGDVFPPPELADAVVRTAYTFASAVARNDGGGRFTLVPLPREAQVAPVYGIVADDVDGDGTTDLLLAGNFDGFTPQIGRAAASRGLLLRGDGTGGFAPARAAESGFFVPGQARDVRRVGTRGGALYVVARNGERPLLFRATGSPRGARPVANR